MMSSKALDEARKDIESRKAWALARDAECGDPRPRSQGALFLTGVRDAVLDQFDTGRDVSDEAHDIADSAVNVYTHARWLGFVDLQAYNEDPTDLGFDGEDMNQGAAVCLYIIAERLVHVLWDELAEAAAEDDEDEVG